MRFQDLSQSFSVHFNRRHFPEAPESLYNAASYMLEDGGKRIRPVLALMGNELFAELHPDIWNISMAIELFHNFTLIHDDIMDKAPLRRGRATVHAKFNESTALLAGDVMLLQAYECMNETDPKHVQALIRLLNKTGREVCEGQQLDMDYEKLHSVSLEQYLHMIELKTAVFLAASLQMGALVAGASATDQQHIYAFGKNLGLAFQVQDDYLDTFGNPETFGKQIGGDILSDKKTFLLVKALQTAPAHEKKMIRELTGSLVADKVQRMTDLFRACGADQAAQIAERNYLNEAYTHLDAVNVPDQNKTALRELADYLLQRET